MKKTASVVDLWKEFWVKTNHTDKCVNRASIEIKYISPTTISISFVGLWCRLYSDDITSRRYTYTSQLNSFLPPTFNGVVRLTFSRILSTNSVKKRELLLHWVLKQCMELRCLNLVHLQFTAASTIRSTFTSNPPIFSAISASTYCATIKCAIDLQSTKQQIKTKPAQDCSNTQPTDFLDDKYFAVQRLVHTE